VLGLLTAETVREFEPVVQVAICWLGLVVGSSYGFVGDRRVPLGRLALGVGVTLFAAACVAAPVGLVAYHALGRDAALSHGSGRPGGIRGVPAPAPG